MSENKAKTLIGLSVVSITKKIMDNYSVDNEDAFNKLLSTDLYRILNDTESGLYLEKDDYLSNACILELEQGKDAMYSYINRE